MNCPAHCLGPPTIDRVGSFAGFNQEYYAILGDLGESFADRQRLELASSGPQVVKHAGSEDRYERLVSLEDAELTQKPRGVKLGDLFEDHAALGRYDFQVDGISHALDPHRAGQACISRPRLAASSIVPTM